MGRSEQKAAARRSFPHVKAPVPQVRGLGAAGIAERLKTCFQPIVGHRIKSAACGCLLKTVQLRFILF